MCEYKKKYCSSSSGEDRGGEEMYRAISYKIHIQRMMSQLSHRQKKRKKKRKKENKNSISQHKETHVNENLRRTNA